VGITCWRLIRASRRRWDGMGCRFWMAFFLDRYMASGHGWPIWLWTRMIEAISQHERKSELKVLNLGSLLIFRSLLVFLPPESAFQFWRKIVLSSENFQIPKNLKEPAPVWDPNLGFLNLIGHATTLRLKPEALQSLRS
jgi:hypothetical protein